MVVQLGGDKSIECKTYSIETTFTNYMQPFAKLEREDQCNNRVRFSCLVRQTKDVVRLLVCLIPSPVLGLHRSWLWYRDLDFHDTATSAEKRQRKRTEKEQMVRWSLVSIGTWQTHMKLYEISKLVPGFAEEISLKQLKKKN